MHQSEISNIERGAALPGYRMLAKLATGLEAEVALVARKPAPRRVRSASKAGAPSRRAPRVPVFVLAVSAKKR